MKRAFARNTNTSKHKTGRYCSCKFGLWSVCAPTKEEAQREGFHYSIQYYQDGDYAALDKHERSINQ